MKLYDQLADYNMESHNQKSSDQLDNYSMKLRDQLIAYRPFNEQEEKDKQVFLTALERDANCFRRSAQAHFTCSAWVVDEARTSTVMVFHNIYNSWSWIGGHADGCQDLQAVALRELAEETGIAHARIIPWNNGTNAESFSLRANEATSINNVVNITDAVISNETTCINEVVSVNESTNVNSAMPANSEGATSSNGSVSPIFSIELLTVDGHEKRGEYVSSHLHLNVTYLVEASMAEPLRVKPDENSGVKWVPLNEVLANSNEPWIRDRIYAKLLTKLQAK